MTRAITTIAPLISLFMFPWLITVLLSLFAAVWEPLVPLAVGVVADALYYSPAVSIVPFYSMSGAVVTAIALFVRTRLRTGSMR